MSNITFKTVQPDGFGQIYADMQMQFPPEELKPFNVFVKLLSEGKLECLGAYDNLTQVGYLIFAKADEFIWLDYIAVKKEFHSKGYGRKILACFKNMFLEVEKPCIENPDTLRRIKFYESLGAKKLGFEYLYPNNSGGLEMDLYFLGDNIPDNDKIFSVVKSVFKNIHADVNELDKFIDKIYKAMHSI